MSLYCPLKFAYKMLAFCTHMQRQFADTKKTQLSVDNQRSEMSLNLIKYVVISL